MSVESCGVTGAVLCLGGGLDASRPSFISRPKGFRILAGNGFTPSANESVDALQASGGLQLSPKRHEPHIHMAKRTNGVDTWGRRIQRIVTHAAGLITDFVSNGGGYLPVSSR